MKYDNPHGDYLGLAMRILEKGAEIKYWLLMKEGEILSMEETARRFEEYISRLGISDLLTYEFAENTISNTSVVHNNVEAVSTVVIGLPIRYTRYTI
jgi:putative aminopeptidase FrvX